MSSLFRHWNPKCRTFLLLWWSAQPRIVSSLALSIIITHYNLQAITFQISITSSSVLLGKLTSPILLPIYNPTHNRIQVIRNCKYSRAFPPSPWKPLKVKPLFYMAFQRLPLIRIWCTTSAQQKEHKSRFPQSRVFECIWERRAANSLAFTLASRASSAKWCRIQIFDTLRSVFEQVSYHNGLNGKSFALDGIEAGKRGIMFSHVMTVKIDEVNSTVQWDT